MVKVSADAFDGKEQIILQTGHNRLFSTNAFQSAAGAPSGLGALVAEHIQFFLGCHFDCLLNN
jgi:hypothetical protein